MSLLGNNGFMSSSDFTALAQTGGQLISALRSSRATQTSSPVLPGAGMVRFLPGPPGTEAAGEAGRRIGSAIGQRIRGTFAGGRRRRRINPLNVRAARRAIRRIKAVRKITAQIERALPTRRVGPRFLPAPSPGRITRAEAARALRR